MAAVREMLDQEAGEMEEDESDESDDSMSEDDTMGLVPVSGARMSSSVTKD